MVVVFVLVFSTVGGGLQTTRDVTTVLATAAVDALDALGLNSLEAAERSLATGAGPAGGSPLNCSISGVTLAGQCQSTAPSSYPLTGNTSEHPIGLTCELGKPPCGSLTWTSVTEPEARTQMAIAYDLADGYAVGFGGTNGTAFFNDTWEFLHAKWTPLNPTRAPSPRAGAAMAYDSQEREVVLFGGHNATADLGDTWTYTNNTWTHRGNWSFANHSWASPSPRTGAAMVNDTRDGYLLLFGGGSGGGTLSDTWKFVGNAWTQLSTAGGGGKITGGSPTLGDDPSQSQNQSAVPVGREDASMVFDATDDLVVMFGGLNVSGNTNTSLNDTWGFSGGTWISLTLPHAPPPRSQAVFGYDPVNNDSVLFGGVSAAVPSEFDDTWTFAGGVWKQVVTTNGSPSPRQGAAGVWDLSSNDFVVFSGEEGGLPASVPDTWTYVNDSWASDHSTMIFSWPAPSARYAASMAFDPKTDVSVLFGGATRLGANAETWTYKISNWTEVFPANGSPPARSFASMAFDGHWGDNYTLLFGGRSAEGVPLGDTWIYHTGTWKRIYPSCPTGGCPPARYGAAMAFDPADNFTLLYGGVGASNTSLGDAWAYEDDAWSNITEGSSFSSPGIRAFAQATYDQKVGEVVLYGGMRGTLVLGDTWTFLGGVWTNITSTIAAHDPPARWGSVFIYSPQNNGTLLFGGCARAINPVEMKCNQLMNDTWNLFPGTNGKLLWALQAPSSSPLGYPGLGVAESEFGLSRFSNYSQVIVESGLVNLSGQPLGNQRWNFAGTWSQWFPPVFPSARYGAEAQYESAQGAIVMFGGYGPLPGGGMGYLDDTWEWDTYVWVPAVHPQVSPSPRAFGAIAWDPNASQVVYFGGEGPTGYFNETWAWLGGIVDGDWHHINTTTAPSARANESMAYDNSPFNDSGYLVLFGGQHGTAVDGDTWMYTGTYNHNITHQVFTGTWKNVTLSLPTAPSARAGASMIYDIHDKYIVLFGGQVPGSSTAFNDTWEFKGGKWTNVTTKVAPPPRYGAAFVDDHWDETVLPDATAAVLFGGESASGGYLNDTWEFYNGTWTRDTHGHSPYPPASAFAAIATDEDDGDVMMFAGTNGNVMDDFWTFF